MNQEINITIGLTYEQSRIAEAFSINKPLQSEAYALDNWETVLTDISNFLEEENPDFPSTLFLTAANY